MAPAQTNSQVPHNHTWHRELFGKSATRFSVATVDATMARQWQGVVETELILVPVATGHRILRSVFTIDVETEIRVGGISSFWAGK